MTKRRIDPPDTLDPVMHFIAKWQSEGWGLDRIDTEIEYAKVNKKSPKIVVGATMTVRMVPQR